MSRIIVGVMEDWVDLFHILFLLLFLITESLYWTEIMERVTCTSNMSTIFVGVMEDWVNLFHILFLLLFLITES